MVNQFVIHTYYFMFFLLTASAIIYLISGLDDLFFDVFYWCRYVFLFFNNNLPKPVIYSLLAQLPEQRIAVMLPCWHEAGVIEEMLRVNIHSIDYMNYDIFIGLYPNDPHTIASVQRMAASISHINPVIGIKPGPTTKADNLNTIFSYIRTFEKENNIKYDIFLLQDAEDIIHPVSFKLYNSYVPKYHMVQTPVFPLDVSLKELLHWTYAAEFSEVHTKEIIVREIIQSLVPSAGVGTAFSRYSLELLSGENQGLPFELSTVTEDYSTAFNLRLHKLKPKFVLEYYWRTIIHKRFFFFGAPRARRVKDFIATRELFPQQYMKAIRQRSRWILGIALQEWSKHGWLGNFTTKYTLIHDRKALITYVNAGLMFIIVPFWILYTYFILYYPIYPTLQDRFEANPWVWKVIIADTLLMLQRVLERGIALFRVYGFWPMLLSPVLVFYGNIVNIHSLFRAYWLFWFSARKHKSAEIRWDKTDHSFPKSEIIPHTSKLGDLAIQKGFINHAELNKLLDSQAKSGKKMGQILVDQGIINKHQLLDIISEQYNLPLVNYKQAKLLFAKQLPFMQKRQYRKLIKYRCYPLNLKDDTITLGIMDPSDELTLTAAVELIKPYDVDFVLLET